MTDDHTYTTLLQRYQDRRALVAQIVELAGENIGLRKRITGLERDLLRERILADAALGCVMPEEVRQ